MLLDHIAIIVSSETGVEFYKELGFEVKSQEDRGYDKLVYLSDGMTTLEVYIDPKHPKRIIAPEALGLRHLGFAVEKIEEFENCSERMRPFKNEIYWGGFVCYRCN